MKRYLALLLWVGIWGLGACSAKKEAGEITSADIAVEATAADRAETTTVTPDTAAIIPLDSATVKK